MHWGGKQTEAKVIAYRVLELLQVPCKTNSATKTVTLPRGSSGDIYPTALENESLHKERSDNIEPACELACESDSGGDDNCDDAECLSIPSPSTTYIHLVPLRLSKALSKRYQKRCQSVILYGRIELEKN